MKAIRNMTLKNYGTHIIMCILCGIVSIAGGSMIGFLLSMLLYVSFCILQFSDGCGRGERASTISATVEKMRAEGREPDAELLLQTYAPKRALIAYLLSSLPLALLALVNLILADPNSVNESIFGVITRIAFFSLSGLIRLFTDMVGINVDGAVQAVVGTAGAVTRGGTDFAALFDNLAGISQYAFAYDLHYLTWMRVCFIVSAFIMPSGMLIGYLQGPRLRVKKLKEIEKGSRRKKRRLKVYGRKKPREIKPEV